MALYDHSETLPRRASRRPYSDPVARAAVGTVVLLGWLFVAWALVSATRA